MFKKILLTAVMLSWALTALGGVTAEEIQNAEAQLRDLIQKMESDQLNYDLYKEQYDELKLEYDRMKQEFALSQATDRQSALCKSRYNDANSALRLRQYEVARTLLDEAITDCPEMAALYLGRAIARKGQGDYQGAEADYLRSIELNEECSTRGNYNLGTLYINNLNRTNDGIARLRQSLECDSTYYKAWYQLGKVKLDQRRNDEAATSFQRAIDLNPGYTRAAIELARIQLNGNCRAAVATLNSVRDAASDSYKSQLYQLLAQAYNNCGQPGNAIDAADQGLRFTSKLRRNKSYISGGLHWEKARALQAQERWQEAVDELREAARSREWRQNAEYEIENRIKKEHPEVN